MVRHAAAHAESRRSRTVIPTPERALPIVPVHPRAVVQSSSHSEQPCQLICTARRSPCTSRNRTPCRCTRHQYRRASHTLLWWRVLCQATPATAGVMRTVPHYPPTASGWFCVFVAPIHVLVGHRSTCSNPLTMVQYQQLRVYTPLLRTTHQHRNTPT